MKVSIIPFEDRYCRQVANLRLKKADKDEVEASTGLSYRRVLQKTLNEHKRNMYLIMYDGTVSGIFGVVNSGFPGVGVGYLLTDDRITTYKWDMAKYTIPVFQSLLKHWSVITNYVSSEHKTSVKWLKKMGARFDGKVYILEDEDVPFYKFEIRKEDYV